MNLLSTLCPLRSWCVIMCMNKCFSKTWRQLYTILWFSVHIIYGFMSNPLMVCQGNIVGQLNGFQQKQMSCCKY
jgi:hypothetical protein